MTAQQLTALTHELQAFDFIEAHHGDCVGADTEFHNLIRLLYPQARIVGHPGFSESDPRRANNACDEIRPVPEDGKLKPPIRRNRNIVDEVDLMFVSTVRQLTDGNPVSQYL
jgi:hypothetical protein